MKHRARVALLLCSSLVAAACDRRLEPWVDASEEPARSSRPVRIPGLGSPVPDPLPAPLAAAPGRGTAEDIRGTLRIADGAKIPPGSVLFVIARSQAGGPPLAVKRLPAGPFPQEFAIGSQDVMLAGRPFAGPILLSARIDTDGDPLTRNPGDLAAQTESPLEPGADSVDLVLAPSNP